MFSKIREKILSQEKSVTWWNQYGNMTKSRRSILFYVLLIHLISISLLCYKNIPAESYDFLFSYLVARSRYALEYSGIFLMHKLTNQPFEVQPFYIDSLTNDVTFLLFSEIGKYSLFTSPVWNLYGFATYISKNRPKKRPEREHIRGAKEVSQEKLMQEMAKEKIITGIPVSNVLKMPVFAETEGTYLIGSPGCGKTTLFLKMTKHLMNSYGRGLIYDNKAKFLQEFYDPAQHFLFNPIDKRHLAQFGGWGLFNEIRIKPDIELVAHSLIPKPLHNDPFWNDGARHVFIGLLHYLYKSGYRTNADIWRVVSSPAADIREWLKNTEGGEKGFRYIEKSDSKMSNSILAVLMQYTSAFEYMAGQDGEFSIDEWLEFDKSGWIFITNYSKLEDTLRPILSLFIDLMGKKILSLSDDYDRRIPIMLDEFVTLQAMDGMVKWISNGRSKGSCPFLGVQDTDQTAELYSGRYQTSIFNACNNKFFFKLNDSSNAEILSKAFHDTEYWEIEETFTPGAKDKKDSITVRRSHKKEPLVSPSQFLHLKKLKCYAKFSNFDVTSITLPDFSKKSLYRTLFEKLKITKKETGIEDFIIRDEFILDNIVSSQAEIIETAEKIKKEIIVKEKKENVKSKSTKDIFLDIKSINRPSRIESEISFGGEFDEADKEEEEISIT